jgi:2-methylcitrate dehydratase PrpD
LVPWKQATKQKDETMIQKDETMIQQATHSDVSPSRILAGFITTLELSDISAEVLESAKMRILDILGICIASQHEPGPQALREAVLHWGGRPEASIIGYADELPAPQAALVNGTLGHSLDFDDTHHASRIHASTVIVPAALAAGQSEQRTGADILTAVIIGLEMIVRIGMVAPGRFHERGLHATSVCGAVAAAGVASRLKNLDSVKVSNTLGIAGSTASGLREAYLGEATDTKAFHAGWAAKAGVTAAELAKRGFTGPSSVFEGRFGYYKAYVSPDAYDLGRLTQDLGKRWYTPEIVFKLYPCGSLIHASIDAALELRERHHPNPADIREIVCIIPPGMVTTVIEPVEQKLNPTSGYHAKFSTQYAVASALLHGNVTEDSYSETQLHDPALRSLLNRVQYEPDPSMPFPEKYPGGVRVIMNSGATFEVRIGNSPGSPDRPATTDDIARKFTGNIVGKLSEARASEVIERVMNLERETSIEDILQLCRTGV